MGTTTSGTRATYRDLAAAAAASSSDELEEYLDHPSPYVRSEAASNLHLTAEQAWRLSDDPDWCVRWQVSRRLVSGLSEKLLSNDDDEVIRAQCLADPNLDPEIRERLMSDRDVVIVLERLARSIAVTLSAVSFAVFSAPGTSTGRMFIHEADRSPSRPDHIKFTER